MTKQSLLFAQKMRDKEKRLWYTYLDEGVIVEGYGALIAVGVGETTVTVVMNSGAEAEFTVTVTAAEALPPFADVDGNGKVDSTDARLILQFAVKKINEFPATK